MDIDYLTSISKLLLRASQLLNCSIYISNYPKKHNLNFSTSCGMDIFYKDIHNIFFYNSLLITANLLKNDSRSINFYSWKDFDSQAERSLKIDIIKNNFKDFGLKKIRDQMGAHIDFRNHNNRPPDFRGIVREEIIENLESIQKELINEFHKYTKSINTPYQNIYIKAKEYVKEIDIIMNTVKPEMTKNDVVG